MSNQRNIQRKSENDRERAAKRAAKNIRKQNQAMSSYLAEDCNYGSFSNQLTLLGLKLRDIPGDGNCLFRALCDQMEGNSENHLFYREETVKYMIDHRNDFEPFVEDDVPFSRHVANLRVDGTFAGNDAMVAFARNNNVNIVIHQLNAPIWTIKGCDRPNARQLHLAYHNGDHYSSIRKINDNGNNPANVKLSESKENETANKRRPSRKHSDSVSDPTLQQIKRISRITGIYDSRVIVEALENTGYDENNAIANLSLSEDEDRTSYVNTTNSYNSKPIWSEGGTGTRIFGNTSATLASSNVQTRKANSKAPVKKMSNKNRKEQARRERKKRSEARKKNSTSPLSDSDESDIIVKNLSFLNI